ncbi:acyl-CoA reductase [Muriicola soli]|uniref:Acyl-CoA reductase n=1 Tax=Muriicola soli TaxID=2507538 RepID=A0A411E963_9FLAO|nr:acyl-CoA reductase [Muriicola soli]QBA64251.1 acyl-CoA reductase [Muriicola soli]
MATLEERFKAFVKLGEFLRNFRPAENTGNEAYEELKQVLRQARLKNGWFSEDNLHHAIAAWGDLLTPENLNTWISSYPVQDEASGEIAIIMAGNIPLVGFHDLLSVLITGHTAKVKLSSNDKDLLPFLMRKLTEFEPRLEGQVQFVEGILKDFDAVIATGSDNTSRYFEYYFGHKPHIIRKNRNSVAVLQGNETQQTLSALGEDIFHYFGLGCRSVSKLFVPESYDFKKFFQAIEPYKKLIDHHKYHNNYDYNKAVYLMSEFPFLDNGFLLLKPDENYASPIGTLFYETYDSKTQIKDKLTADQNKIQCVVAEGISPVEVAFGQTQKPSLTDYADGVDTVEFLLKT